jgi:hypothetical protein
MKASTPMCSCLTLTYNVFNQCGSFLCLANPKEGHCIIHHTYAHIGVGAFINFPWITFRLVTLRLGCYLTAIGLGWVYFRYIRLQMASIDTHSHSWLNWYSVQIDPCLYDILFAIVFLGLFRTTWSLIETVLTKNIAE